MGQLGCGLTCPGLHLVIKFVLLLCAGTCSSWARSWRSSHTSDTKRERCHSIARAHTTSMCPDGNYPIVLLRMPFGVKVPSSLGAALRAVVVAMQAGPVCRGDKGRGQGGAAGYCLVRGGHCGPGVELPADAALLHTGELQRSPAAM